MSDFALTGKAAGTRLAAPRVVGQDADSWRRHRRPPRGRRHFVYGA